MKRLCYDNKDKLSKGVQIRKEKILAHKKKKNIENYTNKYTDRKSLI